MIGGLPDDTAHRIGAAILHTIEMLALVSVLLAFAAGVCFVLARRSAGGRATALRWLAALLAVAALGPPLFLFWAVEH